MTIKRQLGILVLLIIIVLIVTACSSAPQATSMSQPPVAEEHEDENHTHSPHDHMAGQHNVPDEAAAVPNPIEADDTSVGKGAQLFATNCAVCHGEDGEGNGPAAASLEIAPANLHEVHVQELTDGALFYIISHGKPDTPMPAWENLLNVNERWDVVNFLRTFVE